MSKGGKERDRDWKLAWKEWRSEGGIWSMGRTNRDTVKRGGSLKSARGGREKTRRARLTVRLR